MLALDIEHNGSTLSLELPLPIDVLIGELRAIGFDGPLNDIAHGDMALRPINDLGEHFMGLVQPDDTLLSIALACREPEVLEREPGRKLKEMILADRFRDLDHMTGYLRHGPAALDHFVRLRLGEGHIDLPAAAEDLRTAAGDSDPNEINLNDVHYHPLNEKGKELGVIMDYVNPTSVFDDIEEDDDEDWCREPEYDEDNWPEEEQGYDGMGGMA